MWLRFDATTLWHFDAAEWAPSTASIADRAHRAMPDAYVTAHLLREILGHASIEELKRLMNEPILVRKVSVSPRAR